MKSNMMWAVLCTLLLKSFALSAQTKVEKDAIVFMYEEEKLASDVYDSMFVKWNLNPFGHIRKSERMHMAEMQGLLKRYHVKDPALKYTDQPGVFNNASLQALYNELVAKGSISVKDALKAGALIEEVDIRDLKERKKNTVQKEIIEAYDFLIMGSENHLRAFCRNLKGEGIIYEPAILSRTDFDAIISGSNEMGGCSH